MRRSVEPDQTLAILAAGRAPPAGQLEMKDSGWISRVEARMRSSTELGSGKGESEGERKNVVNDVALVVVVNKKKPIAEGTV